MYGCPFFNEVLSANDEYAASFGAKSELALPPARGFAILTCMDARLDPAKYAGLSEGDAHVIRNAGGRASDDAIRSLVISYKLLGTREWFVIHHTNCGMEFFSDESDARAARQQPRDRRARVRRGSTTSARAPAPTAGRRSFWPSRNRPARVGVIERERDRTGGRVPHSLEFHYEPLERQAEFPGNGAQDIHGGLVRDDPIDVGDADPRTVKHFTDGLHHPVHAVGRHLTCNTHVLKAIVDGAERQRKLGPPRTDLDEVTIRAAGAGRERLDPVTIVIDAFKHHGAGTVAEDRLLPEAFGIHQVGHRVHADDQGSAEMHLAHQRVGEHERVDRSRCTLSPAE